MIQLKSIVYVAEFIQIQTSIFYPSRVCLRIKKLAFQMHCCESVSQIAQVKFCSSEKSSADIWCFWNPLHCSMFKFLLFRIQDINREVWRIIWCIYCINFFSKRLQRCFFGKCYIWRTSINTFDYSIFEIFRHDSICLSWLIFVHYRANCAFLRKIIRLSCCLRFSELLRKNRKLFSILHK